MITNAIAPITTTAAIPPATTMALEEDFSSWAEVSAPADAPLEVELDVEIWPRGFFLEPAGMSIVSAEYGRMIP
jgi:hypothetical protein